MRTETYSVEIEINTSESDGLFLPMGRGVKRLSLQRTNKRRKKLEKKRDVIIEDLVTIKDDYENEYILLEVGADERYIFRRDVSSIPPTPNINPGNCLKNGERFCKWKENGIIQKTVNKSRNFTEEQKVDYFGEAIKKKVEYSYPRVKYEYTDEVLDKKLAQDCLGMHSVLCTMLRCSGIPSVIDVGLRLDGNDRPHVWLWYFNSKTREWMMVDLNDCMSDSLLTEENESPKMSVSLGTTHNINGHVVSFVQYFVSEKLLLGELKNPHGVQSMII